MVLGWTKRSTKPRWKSNTACGASRSSRRFGSDVEYKGHAIGKRRIDLIVAGRLVVELKAVEQLTPLHQAQVKTYLKITGLTLGLLINFNVILLKDGIKRVILHP